MPEQWNCILQTITNHKGKMNRQAQGKFVRELCRNIEREVAEQIKSKRIPTYWDGHELRMLLAEKFAASGRMSSIANEPRSSRARDYRNTVIVRNL